MALVFAARLIPAASVQDYLAAFEREMQRLAADPQQFIAETASPQAYEDDPRAEAVQLPGVDRHGDIYHVRGRVFLRRAALPEVAATAQSYGKHSEIFGPRIAASAICSRPAADTVVYRYWTKSYRDSVSETRAVHRQADANRVWVDTRLIGIGGTEDVAGPSRLCTGTLKGVFYLKDVRAVWRYQQVAGGVWVEADMVAVLSGFSLVKTIARRNIRELLEDGLRGWKRHFSK